MKLSEKKIRGIAKHLEAGEHEIGREYRLKNKKNRNSDQFEIVP